MGRLDLSDPRRDEELVLTQCACCRSAFAEVGPDPRLPALEVDACAGCRDVIARWCGWWPSNGAWQHLDTIVRLSEKRTAPPRAKAKAAS